MWREVCVNPEPRVTRILDHHPSLRVRLLPRGTHARRQCVAKVTIARECMRICSCLRLRVNERLCVVWRDCVLVSVRVSVSTPYLRFRSKSPTSAKAPHPVR